MSDEIEEIKSDSVSTNAAEEKSEKYKMMVETPVRPLILRLAVPTIISMMVTGIYNSVDTYFVGKISTEATAAVGIVFSVMAVIQAIGFFWGHGSGNYISRSLGAGNKKEAEEMASTGFVLALISGVICTVVGLILLKRISYFLGASDATLKDTETYMAIILIGAPFTCGQFVLNNLLRFQGNAFYAMICLLIGAGANIILDPLLILVFHMGVAGAAIATIVGQLISMTVLFMATRRGENIRLSMKCVKINFHYIKEAANGGAPSLARQGLAAVSTMLLNNMAGEMGGDAAIAGMSVVTRVMMLVYSALIGFGQGYQPVCAFNFGAKKYDRVTQGYIFCVIYGTLFLVIMSTFCIVFPDQIISFFRDDPDVVKVGAESLRWQAFAFPLGGTLVMTNMMLQSMGRGLKASLLSSARNGIFFIPAIFILPRLLGLFGVEITQMVADIMSFLLAVPFAVSEIRLLKRSEPLG